MHRSALCTRISSSTWEMRGLPMFLHLSRKLVKLFASNLVLNWNWKSNWSANGRRSEYDGKEVERGSHFWRTLWRTCSFVGLSQIRAVHAQAGKVQRHPYRHQQARRLVGWRRRIASAR